MRKYLLLLIFIPFLIAAMPGSRTDREYQKFVEDDSGDTAIRVKIAGDITLEGSIKAADGVGPILFDHPISVGGSGERTSFNTYGQYFDGNDSVDSDAVMFGFQGSELKTTVPLNSAVEDDWIKRRVYKDDTFADDEVMPLSMRKEIELLTNPELDGTYIGSGTIYRPPSWNDQGLDAGVDACAEETTIVHTAGGKSAHVTVDASNEGITQDRNTTYIDYLDYGRLSAWIKVVAGTVRIQVLEQGGDYTSYGIVTTTSTDWTLINVDFQKENDASVGTSIKIASSGAGAEWYVDDISTTIITPTSGFGQASCGDEHMMFSWETDGSVNITGTGTTNTAATDSDTDFCVYDGGYTPYLKNRLGASKEMRCITWFD